MKRGISHKGKREKNAKFNSKLNNTETLDPKDDLLFL
jgi:hypothetical protein